MPESVEEQARRILADIIAPGKRIVPSDGSYVMTSDAATGAISYCAETDQGQITLTIHTPEKFATAFLEESIEAHKVAVIDKKTGKPLIGTTLGSDMTGAIESNAHNTLYFFMAVIGEKIFEMLTDAADEAQLLSTLFEDTNLARCAHEWQGDLTPGARALEKIDMIADDAARRRRTRMRAMLDRLAPYDEIVARAITLCREKKYPSLQTLVNALGKRFDIEISAETLGKRFQRAGISWKDVKALKIGQK